MNDHIITMHVGKDYLDVFLPRDGDDHLDVILEGGPFLRMRYPHYADKVAVQAMVDKANRHDELLSLANRWAALFAGAWNAQRYVAEQAELLADTNAAIAAIKAGEQK